MSKKKHYMEFGVIGLGRTGTDKLFSALRYGFGGHQENSAAPKGGD